MDDKREAPVNPYQSPRCDPAAEENAASPERVYGLRRPIRIQGTLSAEDIRQRYRLTLSDRIKALLFVLMLVALAGLVLLQWTGPVQAAGVTATLVLALLALWLLARYAGKRHEKEVEKNAVLEKTTITEEEIVAEAETGRVVLRWSAFFKCECSDEMVLLHCEPGGGYAIFFPRRFFASEDDWETFLGLVRCKLPEDDQRARRLAAARKGRLPAGVPAGEVDAAAEAGPWLGPALRARGAVSWEDWKEIRRLALRPWRECILRIGCLIPFLAGFVLLALTTGSKLPLWLNVPIFSGAALLSVLFVLVLPPLRLRGQWKRQEGPFAPFEVRVGDGGVEWIRATSRATIPWGSFAKFTHSQRVLILHQTRPALIRFIPRSFCSTRDEWEALLRLVREKLPEK